MFNLPRYTTDISRRITAEEARKMYELAESPSERTLVSIIWLSGARTMEVMVLEKKDIAFDFKKFSIHLPTLKLGKVRVFVIKDRLLEFDRATPSFSIYIETIINQIERLPNPESRLLEYSDRWSEKVINRLSEVAVGESLSVYHFRHSALTREAAAGATIDQLMHMKGAKDTRSVGCYLHASSYKVKGV